MKIRGIVSGCLNRNFGLALKEGYFDYRVASYILILVMLAKRRYLAIRLSLEGLINPMTINHPL
jgi:hypothetical protein